MGVLIVIPARYASSRYPGKSRAVLRCNEAALTALQSDRKSGLVGDTTAVFNREGKALYFSKEVLPFTESLDTTEGQNAVY